MTMSRGGEAGCPGSHGTKYGVALSTVAEGRVGSLKRNYEWGMHLISLEVVEGRASDYYISLFGNHTPSFWRGKKQEHNRLVSD